MNDRLGGTTDNYNAGNIRFYGANPNNYIDIGDYYKEDTVINNMEKNSYLIDRAGITDEDSCHTYFDCDTNYSSMGNMLGENFTDASSCKKIFDYETTEEICGTVTKKAGDPVLYRIIGILKDVELSNGTKKDLLKVIREDSIGNFAWDLKDAEGSDYNNNWYEATLNNILNNGYLTSLSNVTHFYYNPLTQTSLTITTDFTNKEINYIQDKITSVMWNLGGYNKDAYSDEMYKYERGDNKCADCTY